MTDETSPQEVALLRAKDNYDHLLMILGHTYGERIAQAMMAHSWTKDFKFDAILMVGFNGLSLSEHAGTEEKPSCVLTAATRGGWLQDHPALYLYAIVRILYSLDKLEDCPEVQYVAKKLLSALETPPGDQCKEILV